LRNTTLGGGYRLYDVPLLSDGLVTRYDPGEDDYFAEFVADLPARQTLARENLLSYHFFWARLDHEKAIREGVESALIVAARGVGAAIQNERVSRRSENCHLIVVNSAFPDGVAVRGIPPEVRYGVREA
jgi:hypothetical protein